MLKCYEPFDVQLLLFLQYSVDSLLPDCLVHRVKLVAIVVGDEGLAIIFGQVLAAFYDHVPVIAQHLLLSSVSVETVLELALYECDQVDCLLYF